MSNEKSIPSVLAVLMCDVFITDTTTGKKTLVGIFDGLSAAQFPLKTYPFAVYAKLTDMEGDYNFRIDLIGMEDEARLATFTMRVKSPASRLEKLDCVFSFQTGVEFERPGHYEFQLYADDVFIGRCTMEVQKREAQQ